MEEAENAGENETMKKVCFIIMFLLFITAGYGSGEAAAAPIRNADTSRDAGADREDRVLEEYLAPLLTALKNRDKEAMCSLWVDITEPEEKEQFFELFFDIWNGRTWNSAEKLEEKRRQAEGAAPGATIYSYLVDCGEESPRVELAVSDDSGKIDWIRIAASPVVTGTPSTWRQFNTAQWIMTILAVIEVLFSVWMTVLCVKRKPRLWGLWVMFILSVYAGIIFMTKGDLIISFFIYTFAFPKILDYQNLGMRVYLSLPLGAAVYYFRYGREQLRKRKDESGKMKKER